MYFIDLKRHVMVTQAKRRGLNTVRMEAMTNKLLVMPKVNEKAGHLQSSD